MNSTSFSLELIKKHFVAQNVLLCKFRLINGQNFNFIAGQHIILKIPDTHAIVDRPFSILSHPQKRISLDVIVKLGNTGAASNFFRNVELGHVLMSGIPRGDFIIRSFNNPLVFIGAGTGIAPLFSMIVDVLETQRTPESLYLLFYKQEHDYSEFDTYLRTLESAHANFRFDVIADERKCTELFRQGDFPVSPEFYICGGKDFVQDMKGQLIHSGFDSQTIYCEQ